MLTALSTTIHSNWIFFYYRRAFTVISIIKYTSIAVGISGLIITLLAALNAEVNNKKAQTIQPSTYPAAERREATSAQKSALESERY